MGAVMLARASLFLPSEAALPGPAGRMDRLCGLSVCVADQVLGPPGAGLLPALHLDPTRVGVAVGTAHGCHKIDEAYYRGVLAAGGQLAGASPRLFVYTLPSSPAGEVSIRHGLRGPGLAEVSGATAGLGALAEALYLLDSGQAEAMLLCAVDEPPSGLDGAAAILLASGQNKIAAAEGRPLGEVLDHAEAFCPGDPGQALKEVLAALGPARACRCDPRTAQVLAALPGGPPPLDVLPEWSIYPGYPGYPGSPGEGRTCSAAVASVHLLAQPAPAPVESPTVVLCCDPLGQAAGCLIR
jgi:hypothetical protein